ncbi:MAG: hypothetical protein Q9176_001141 [Flavoplaca citrina]
MATGIEIAGLTLAVFPIAIDGLAHFVEGVRIIKSWGTFRSELASYQYGLRTAHAFFQNTIEELYEGIATPEDILMFRGNLEGMAKRNPEYEKQLKIRLDHDYDNCLEAMTRILSAMKTLVRKLDLDAAGKIMWDDRPTIKREVRRIKIVLSKKIYKELLNDIDKANQDLLLRTHQGRRLESSRSTSRSKRQTVDFASVRSRVKSLWDALVAGKSWRCACQNHHAASLRLDPQQWEKDTLEEHIRFQVLLNRRPLKPDTDASWNNQVIEVLSSKALKAVEQGLGATKLGQRPTNTKKTIRFAASPAKTQPSQLPSASKVLIDNMCTAIHTSAGTKCCLGFLADDGKGLHNHEVFLIESPIGKVAGKSLQGLLKHPKQRIPGQKISWRDSLSIAVTLASSIIQLDGTGWLRRQWDSQDIVFLTPDDYAHPYLCWNIPPEDTNLDDSSTARRHIRCIALASLGITLVELCFGQNISNLQAAEDAAANATLASWNTAIRLLPYIDMERGERYSDVVRRCLECPFDVRKKTLNNEIFQKAVFDSIVVPLREELENFVGVGMG